MRVRAERHDQALVALKREHQAHVEALTSDFKRSEQELSQRHNDAVQRLKDESIARLDAAVESNRREKDDECARIANGLRYELEEAHKRNLSSMMQQHQDALQGISEQHKVEIREKVAQMAIQKDELHVGDKQVAIREAARDWELETERRVRQRESELRYEHEQELEKVQQSCKEMVESLAAQHAEERQKMGGDMLDQREEIRSMTAKFEQAKAAKLLEEAAGRLGDEHAAALASLRSVHEGAMEAERERLFRQKAEALRAKEAELGATVSALERDIDNQKADFELKLRTQLADSGRITEKLQAERDKLLLGNNG